MCKQFPQVKPASFSSGWVETRACNSLEDLRCIIKGLGPKQVLIMGHVKGTQDGETTCIGTKGKCLPGEIPRITANFEPSSIVYVDYDYSDEFPFRRASEVHNALCTLLPQVFEGASYLARKSSTGRVLKAGEASSKSSWHLYYKMDRKIPTRWLADHIMEAALKMGKTYEKKSADGKTLKRTIIDLQPLKIGAIGLSYEADPLVDGVDYKLSPARMKIVPGCEARTSILRPVGKSEKKERCKPKADSRDNGFYQKSRKLHYSPEYRSLPIDAQVTLDDLCMEFRGKDYGTKIKPIKCPYQNFRVDHRRVKRALNIIQAAGFIRFDSGQKKRVANEYYLNFEKLFMKQPRGWSWE